MANRGEDKGDMVMVMKKMSSKYDPASEKEVIDWINIIIGSNIQYGRENVKNQLRSGEVLVQLINAIYQNSANLPAEARMIRIPIKSNAAKTPFLKMENIENFLNAVAAYGVPANSSFQTVDLYEARNMAQVLNGLLQLGTECQRNGFSGPVCGAKPCTDNRRKFTMEQLKSSEGILTLQAGTNKFATQKGMSMGNVRHCNNIKVNDMHDSGKGHIGLQAGTNKFANQSGMTMGGIRHVSDMKINTMDKKSEGILGLQSGSSKGANQSGMTMGGIRHISDLKVNEMTKEGKNFIGLQYGTNKGANQSGMNFGGQRHITNIKCDPIHQVEQHLIDMLVH